MAKEGINTIELARKIGVPQPTLHKILTGKSKRPRPATIRIIADYFKVDITEITLDQNGNKDLLSFRMIPILNWSNIRAWLSNDKSVAKNADTMPVKSTSGELTFATIPNDNILPQYKNGSILVFDPELPPKDGSLILIAFEEHKEILLRQLVLDIRKKFIQSLNPALGSRLSEIGEKDKILATLIQVIINYEEI
jgi:transcriptional regulator with XRE-family HTH domain